MWKPAAVLLLAITVPAQAAETINKRLEAHPDGEVVIDLVRGKVRVLGWDENAVSVEGRRDEESEEFHFERNGKVIYIEDHIRDTHFHRGGGTDITVRIPRRNDLDLSGVAVDAAIRGLEGEVRADLVSGGLDVEEASGELRLETVSGNVTVRSASRRLEVESVSGRVRVVNDAPLSRGTFSAVSGSVGVETALAPNADLEVESISGEIELVLRGDINARIRAETGPGGDIRNDLTKDQPERVRYVGSETLDLRLGSGGGDVRASVISGEIILRKR